VRVAIVHPYPVHARAVGGTTRVYGLVRHLRASGHEVTVLAHSSGTSDADRVAIDDLAGLGAVQRLFPLPRPSLLRRVPWALGRVPYFVRRNRNPGLEAALVALAPEVVHVEHALLAPLLSGVRARAPCILAEQETMSVAIERLRAATGRTPYEWYLLSQRRKVVAFERRALSGYDRIWAITRREASYLSELAGREVGVLPHVVDTRVFAPREPDAGGARLLFVGNYAHRPNLHGIRWFVEQVWPRVRAASPEALLELAGPGLDGAHRNLVERAGGRILGRVEDLPAAYRAASVVVNPIRSGAGMRGKVLEAFACGRAVVSTALGMEGIDARPGEHFLLADPPSAFAEAVVRYLRSAALRRQHGLASRALVERAYDTRRVYPLVEAGLAAAVAARAGAAA